MVEQPGDGGVLTRPGQPWAGTAIAEGLGGYPAMVGVLALLTELAAVLVGATIPSRAGASQVARS